MSSDPTLVSAAHSNHFLSGLPNAELNRLLAGACTEEMEIHHVLFEPHDELQYVHFPLSGVISLVTHLSDGDAVEMATVGNEGVVGLPWARDSGVASYVRGICQVRGASVRVKADRFRQELSAGGVLAARAGQFDRALFALVGQNGACNRLHTINQRCARWMLMTHERVGADEFNLTHEFLSQMLGARRASVTEAAAGLQDLGAITYRRGEIRVLSRAVLEKQTCECYGVVRSVYDGLYQDPASTS
ncbi:MAG: Crp/Fnr family transcriptional regulator [Actinomycetota bacterium]